MQHTYKTKGICASEMTFTVENGIVTGLAVKGGCDGNLKGIIRLVEGMPAEEVIARLEGLNCKEKGTSCPDQLAQALKAVI